MINIVYVGAGGFLGASLRFLINSLIKTEFPYATLISNIIACFLIGFIMTLVNKNINFPYNLKIFLVTGFLGGLSTFSSFSYETVVLADFNIIQSFLNIILNLSLCVFFTLTGIKIASLF